MDNCYYTRIILSFLISRMVAVYDKISDKFGRMLVVGDISIFTVQAVYNISMVLVFLPLTSIPLPFISYGLMPTVLNTTVVGIVLSVYRRKDLIFVTATLK
ncbi:FtsW/RodA/SpoVE family cell cycle protein [Bacillus sp. SCS-151]|uniref:FtsW/RodA/SpoVE family cell cycle protein n=1 Tax=Nanhaiella sioensis TaxID=3115293 RepID=UPI0039785163